jgi:hypothetical protein
MAKYQVTLSITGRAIVEMTAPSAEAARHAVVELTLSDLAMTGRADILTFKVIPGEITKLLIEGDDDDDEPRQARPSGWYRPG